MNVAIILASGSGTRFGADRPKQFLDIAGRTVLEHTIAAFQRHAGIDEIAVVTRPEYIEEVSTMAERDGFVKVRRVLTGGRERYFSTLAALEAYTDGDDCLLIHDGVRPLVTQRIIGDCLAALRLYDAVDVAVPTTDTIIEVDDGGHIVRTPPRSALRNVQTPQCFRRRVLAEAFRLALQDAAFQPTDDCSVVCRYLPSVRVKVVEGDTRNIKITYPQDLETARRVLAAE